MESDTGSAAENAAEVPEDPGLIILYDPEAVHIALGQPNSPVAPLVNMRESFEIFKNYVYRQVLLTPCNESDHAIRKCDGGPGLQESYFTELFHRLPADTYRAIIEVLHKIFITGNSPVADWSCNVSAAAGIQNSLPPNRPLGTLIKVEGGLGLGRVTFSRVAVTRGVLIMHIGLLASFHAISSERSDFRKIATLFFFLL